MNKSKMSLLVLFVIFAVNTGALASDSVEASVTAFLKSHKVPGAAVALIRDGKVLDEVIYGSANLQLAIPVQRHTVFQLASVAKSFTAITLLQLEQSGKLTLDDPLSKYLTGLPKNWEAVTLRELATHTSGLPDLIASPDKPLSDAELGRSAEDALKYAESIPVESVPGSQFKYDQTNYLLLSQVIEKICGQKFRDCVASHLLKVAGMTGTSWGDARSIVPSRADMYTALHGGQVENGANLFSYPGYLDAAGGINSDLADMEQLAMALTSGKLLSAAELQKMLEPARTREGAIVDIGKEMGISGVLAPAAGWFYADNSAGDYPRAFMSGGSAVSILLFPKQKVCVVVLTNLQDKDDPLSVAEDMAKHYLPELKPML